MKKFNFGKIFALMAAGAAVFALVFAGCEQVNGVIRNALEQPKTAKVAGADDSGLKDAFADPSVKIIEIQSDIYAEKLNLNVAPGDKTISIPGGKETAVGSMKLSADSHVKLTNSGGGTAKSVGSALAASYSEQKYEGWATLVIWENFEIPEGATFDLTGEVRLVFRTAKVDGDLKADLEYSILGAGGKAPEITGNGNVQTSKEAEPKKPEQAALDIKPSENHEALPTVLVPEPIAITTTETGIMDKGGTRQFTANRTVTWTVEGGDTKNLYNMDEDTKSVNTTITADGLLTIAADEPNITLTVRATSGEETETETVKVKGWKKVNLYDLFYFMIGNSVNGKINGIAYGDGKWVAVGDRGKMAYSTDGESWEAVDSTIAVEDEISFNKVIYDGPETGKKFIAVGNNNTIVYSSDGKNWTPATVTDKATNFSITGIAYGNDKFIAVDYKTSDKTMGTLVSSDGATWTRTSTDFSSYGSVVSARKVAFGNGMFVCSLANFGIIAKSTDGTNWSVVANGTNSSITGYDSGITALSAGDRLFDIIYDGNKFIAVGGKARIAIGTNDVASWSLAQISGMDTSVSAYPDFIIFAGGKYITTTRKPNENYALIYASSLTGDGASGWDAIAETKVSNNTPFTAAAYGDGKYIAAIVTDNAFRGIMIAHEETLE